MVRFDGTRPEFSPYGFTCEVWTPARMPRLDRHSEIEINLLKAGSITYLFGGHRTTVKAGRLAVFWAAIPHQIVGFEGEEPYFVVTWPLGELLASKLDLNVVNRILQGELLMELGVDDCDQLKFAQWERALRTSDRACEHATRLEVQARLLRFAGRISNGPAVRHSTPMLGRADKIARYDFRKSSGSQRVSPTVLIGKDDRSMAGRKHHDPQAGNDAPLSVSTYFCRKLNELRA